MRIKPLPLSPLLPILMLALPPTSAAGDAAARAQARDAVAVFSTALKSEQAAAMQSGGPLNAIEVCHERAPAIAAAVSLDSGMDVSRVSLRNRNPGNAPNAWQAAVLEDFEARLATGENIDALTWQEIAD